MSVSRVNGILDPRFITAQFLNLKFAWNAPV